MIVVIINQFGNCQFYKTLLLANPGSQVKIQYMSDPERPNLEISEETAIQFINLQVENWRFTDHSDADNIHFAFCVASWASELFDEVVRFGSRDDIAGEELPVALKGLVIHHWPPESRLKDEGILVGGNRVALHKNPDFEYTDTYIPKYDELKQQSETFDELVAKIQSDPEIKENIRPAQLIEIERYSIQFRNTHYNWGLQFRVSRDTVSCLPFGDYNSTEQTTNFVLTYYNKPRVLTSIICNLVVLALQHSDRGRYSNITSDDLLKFEQSVLGNEEN